MAKRRPEQFSEYSDATPKRGKRRFSGWTLVAPAALVLVVFAFWIAIGSSSIRGDDAPDEGSEAAQVEAAEQEAEAERQQKFDERKKSVRLQSGGSLEAIADDNGMTLEELLELNPQIKDPRVVQVGQIVYLRPRNG